MRSLLSVAWTPGGLPADEVAALRSVVRLSTNRQPCALHVAPSSPGRVPDLADARHRPGDDFNLRHALHPLALPEEALRREFLLEQNVSPESCTTAVSRRPAASTSSTATGGLGSNIGPPAPPNLAPGPRYQRLRRSCASTSRTRSTALSCSAVSAATVWPSSVPSRRATLQPGERTCNPP